MDSLAEMVENLQVLQVIASVHVYIDIGERTVNIPQLAQLEPTIRFAKMVAL